MNKEECIENVKSEIEIQESRLAKIPYMATRAKELFGSVDVLGNTWETNLDSAVEMTRALIKSLKEKLAKLEAIDSDLF